MALHYYTVPKTWAVKGSATAFDEAEYFTTMQKALRMEELINRHATIMDQYDPNKRVALAVDEWGIWTDAEAGTNPAFLYQQNSLRDALIAASTLNIFNNHCDRVRLANLAQTVNVLQSLILTKGNEMILTPTYHVFDMYKVHQDAQYLPVKFTSPDYMLDNQKIPSLSLSASKDSTGAIHITLVNINPNKPLQLQSALGNVAFTTVKGSIVILRANVTDINTFEKPNNIRVQNFSGARKVGNELQVQLPAKSVVMLELR